MATHSFVTIPVVSQSLKRKKWLTTGMLTKEWVAIHRKHHAKVETPDDPHSPQTRGIKTVFWQGAELYRDEAKNLETLDKYGRGTPDDWMERNVYSRYSWEGVGLMCTRFSMTARATLSAMHVRRIASAAPARVLGQNRSGRRRAPETRRQISPYSATAVAHVWN